MALSNEKNYEQVMLDYLPDYYNDIKEAVEVIKTEATEFKEVQKDVESVLEQFYVDKATWGLEYWEKACGIKPNPSKPIEERKSEVKAKLRGLGTMTVEYLKNAADSFYETDVIENYSSYTITFRIVGIKGEPSNIEQIRKSMRELVPAHLTTNFEFTFVVWNDLTPKIWDEITTLTWDELIIMND